MESCGFIAHDVYAIALEATGGRCNPLLTEWLAGQYSTHRGSRLQKSLEGYTPLLHGFWHYTASYDLKVAWDFL